MDIAALSMALSQQQLLQSVSFAVTDMAMDVQQQSTDQLMEMIDAPHPTLGSVVDISV